MSQKHKLHISRDLVLFVTGLAGIIYETLGSGAERPTLLVLFAGMVGLPVFLRLDGKKEVTVYEKEKPE